MKKMSKNGDFQHDDTISKESSEDSTQKYQWSSEEIASGTLGKDIQPGPQWLSSVSPYHHCDRITMIRGWII